MNKLRYLGHCKTLDEVKAEYKKLTQQWMVNENDPGSMALLDAIDQEYAAISQRTKFKQLTKEIQEEFIGFPKIVKELISLELNLEICGIFLWVNGNTYDHVDKLKELGLKYSPNKKMWYYRPKWFRSTNTTPVDMEFIRKKYGSDTVEREFVFDQPTDDDGQGRIQV